MKTSFCSVCGQEMEVDDFNSCTGCGLDLSTPVPDSTGRSTGERRSSRHEAKESDDAGQSEAPCLELTVKAGGKITGTVWRPEMSCVLGRIDAGGGPVDFDLTGYPGEEYVSAEHATVYLRDGRWMLADLDSTNGTYVDGKRIENPVILSDGQTIALGTIKLLVRIP